MNVKTPTLAQKLSYHIESNASSSQMDNRDTLKQLWKNSPLSDDDLLFNLGLYTRSSLLVKFLVLSDIYKRILKVPGLICEFGTWWGQNLILFENLRAIYEPFNKQRRIIGFDTFSGYTPPGSNDRNSDVWAEHSYSTTSNYKHYLDELLRTHEGCNVLGHKNGNHELIEGDVTVTAPQYFQDRAHSIVALAYVDIGLYEPTKAALTAVKPHLVPGSVILLDELTWDHAPGESLAFKEIFRDSTYKLEKCDLYPSKSIVTIV